MKLLSFAICLGLCVPIFAADQGLDAIRTSLVAMRGQEPEKLWGPRVLWDTSCHTRRHRTASMDRNHDDFPLSLFTENVMASANSP